MKDEEILLDGDDARVRIIGLAAGEATPWHHHGQVTDNCFCLTGHIEVQFVEPDQSVPLMPGARCTVEVGRIHRIVNTAAVKARYLLVQTGGRYDFIRRDP